MTHDGYHRLDWHRLSVPADLPEVVDEISYQRVVMNAGATWDYFPGHYDPQYAEKNGHPGIFVNTMHLAGFVDRIANDWAGPYSRVVRRKISLLGSIYAGDSMVGRGRSSTSVATPRVRNRGISSNSRCRCSTSGASCAARPKSPSSCHASSGSLPALTVD